MRILIFFMAGALATLAFVIYGVKYDARGLETRAGELRDTIREERDAIAVLRAEWSLLNRPDRLERLSKKHLGLAPLPGQRMISTEQLKMPRRQPTLDNDLTQKIARPGKQPVVFEQ